MASYSANGGAGGNSVVGPQYCAAHPVELLISTQVFSTRDRFNVRDINNNLLFKVKSESAFSFSQKRIIVDAAGNPILTLRPKSWSLHNRWKVFRGNSKDPKDLIFTVKLSSVFQLQTSLNVYWAYNTTEELCDFKVRGSYFERSCVVYAGESHSAIVAEMHKKFTAGSFFLGKDKFMVTVYPNIDYAFIVALIVILAEIINSRSSASSSAGSSA